MQNEHDTVWKSIDWPIFEVLVGGKSSIDLNSLALSSSEEAKRFLRTYGHDPANKEHQKSAHAMFVESIKFIEHELMPREWQRGIRPPQELLQCQSPGTLLKFASNKERDPLAVWSCAILKIMHTISHMDRFAGTIDTDEARRQIVARFQSLLQRDADDNLCFKSKNQEVKIDKIDWKNTKDRNSILLKLLHKPGNVAETIYDTLGARIIVENHADTVKVLNFLATEYIISFPNSYPSRSRNTLIDVDKLRKEIQGLCQKLQHGEISNDEFTRQANLVNVPATIRGSDNPHSSKAYRSIQMTCRQLVSYPDPKFSWLSKIDKALKNHELKDKKIVKIANNLSSLVSSWRGDFHNEVKIYFPFEIQIFDRTSSQNVLQGDASHGRYKQAQVRTARKRLLHEILSK